MADFSKFRTSFNGFNRTDVVNYIESASLEHRKELAALKKENEQLRAEKEAAEQALLALQKEKAAPAVPAEPVNVTEQELAAYRRAEAAERSAVERAAKLREKLSALCDDAAQRCVLTDKRAAQVAEDAAGCAARLQQTVQQLQSVIADTEKALKELDLPE